MDSFASLEFASTSVELGVVVHTAAIVVDRKSVVAGHTVATAGTEQPMVVVDTDLLEVTGSSADFERLQLVHRLG